MNTIEIIDLGKNKQSCCRVMNCQVNANEFQWQKESGLYFLQKSEKLTVKIREFLKIAKQYTIDVLVFPELSVPESLIGLLQEWSNQHGTIVICGSHYYKTANGYISRCPIIISGVVYFSEKLNPAPIEKSPIEGDGIVKGTRVLKFVNSSIGNFSVLICSDYLDDDLKKRLNLNSLDCLFVPSFQKESDLYYSRMDIECSNSQTGLYIVYSNFYDGKNGDGRSAFFGLMDRLFTDKLKERGFTDLQPKTKLFEFRKETEYVIHEFSLEEKRPFINRSIETNPNVMLVSASSSTVSKDLLFIQKIANDDERYQRIEELYVPPKEYEDIYHTLEKSNLVIIIGDPGIGKTYTAVRIMKDYFNKGFEPIWFSGLEKEDRDMQSKALRDFTPTEKQVVYFEDPFGRTVFEKRESLLQVFSPLVDKLAEYKSKIIITSRKEVFEDFSKESLLEKDVILLKRELNVRNPSYDDDGLISIFNKLAALVCPWYDDSEFRDIVHLAITEKKITTPLSIRDLVFVSRSITTIEELNELIEKRENEIVKVFALEILATGLTTKIILYLTFFCGLKGKLLVSELFERVSKHLVSLNFAVHSFSLNLEIRSQIGYRIEQLGQIKTAYRFSHPVYEEALAILFSSDKHCELISKAIIKEFSVIDPKSAYITLNKLVAKYPEMSLSLFRHLLEEDRQIKDDYLKVLLSKKLIAVYYETNIADFFFLATEYYPLGDLINNINSIDHQEKDLINKLELVLRYMNNSPQGFDSSAINKIDFYRILSNTRYVFQPNKLLQILSLSHRIDPTSIKVFTTAHDLSIIKRIFLGIEKPGRVYYYKLFENNAAIQVELYNLQKYVEKSGSEEIGQILYKKILFSEFKYYGKIIIDPGAANAIKRLKRNLLPVGIIDVIGDFPAGVVVGIFDTRNTIIGVGITEYPSSILHVLKGYSSNAFFELIGYFHSSCAIKDKLLHRFWHYNRHEVKKWRWSRHYQGSEKDS
ncbi:PUA domain-containing protein [Chitinophaga sp. S165]|uniref:nSTAND3 domain-containing NTPase n=1 Tax=Chitinophaga sp. S165 TaxID=2135462 RepID=UPI000D70B86A|nr:PUA domain-containing protein [Chitinophaga sp. S165]PWV53258.1 PUA domain-containing protein [Chitinophaga sp. S165]